MYGAARWAWYELTAHRGLAINFSRLNSSFVQAGEKMSNGLRPGLWNWAIPCMSRAVVWPCYQLQLVFVLLQAFAIGILNYAMDGDAYCWYPNLIPFKQGRKLRLVLDLACGIGPFHACQGLLYPKYEEIILINVWPRLFLPIKSLLAVARRVCAFTLLPLLKGIPTECSDISTEVESRKTI